MSVAEPVIDYLDLTTKHIYLRDGVREYHPVEDIYAEVRNLRKLNESYRVFDIPVKAYGNIAKGGGKYTPRYAMFNNGWKVVPEDTAHTLSITGEQITDDGQSGPACIDISVLTSPVIIQYAPPAAEIVRDEESLSAIARMSFNEKINIDPINGESIAGFTGNPRLLGNTEFAVSNFVDAVTLANSHYISELYFKKNNTLSLANVSGFNLVGSGALNSSLTIDDAADCNKIWITKTKLSGVLDGDINIERCIVDGIQYFNGGIRECQITNEPIVLFGATPSRFISCRWAMTGGLYEPSIIDCNDQPTPILMSDYIGHLKIINRTVDCISTIDFSGVIEITSSCTAGTFMLAGNGKVIDNSTGTCVVDASLVLSPENNAIAVWNEDLHDYTVENSAGQLVHSTNYLDKHVYINTELAENGCGTSNKPFNNVSDAVDFAEARGWKQLRFLSDATLERKLKNFVIEGIGNLPVIDINGQDVDRSEFLKVKLTGTQVGFVTAREVVLLNLQGVNGVYKDSGMIGDITLADDAIVTIASASNLPVSVGTMLNTINMGNGSAGAVLNLRKYSGGVQLTNVNRSDRLATCEFAGGKLLLDNSNTAGNITVCGLPDTAIFDSSAGSTVNKDCTLPGADTITSTVWSTDDAQKLLEESLGHAVISPDDRHVTIRRRSDDSISHEYDISADKRERTPV